MDLFKAIFDESESSASSDDESEEADVQPEGEKPERTLLQDSVKSRLTINPR